MAQSLIDRAWRATTPDEIEPDLAALWREVGQQRRVARAVLSNLVVVRERPAARAGDAVNADEIVKDLTLDEVVARHPSRVILIQHNPATQTACAPSAVSVGIITFGPPHARYGVEQIVVQSACAEQSLPSIIRRLLRGDVPTSVWWTDDLSEAPPLDGIVAMARQFVYDSRRWRDVRGGVLALATLHRRLDLADVNWRRLTPLRHALIHACGAADADHLRRANVEIVHRAAEGALAWLVVGWLSARLEWGGGASPRVAESRDSNELISISVGTDLTAALDEHRVLVTRRGSGPSFTVSVPHEGEADAVAAELRNLGHDACLRDAVTALLARFSA
jgi:glucose-6-phosphate dehydrogenase assembly protein OpcA